jgi:hypothetical protein
MQKTAAQGTAAEGRHHAQQPAGPAAELALLARSAYLNRLRATVTETYAALSSDRTEAVEAVEKTIAALARAEVPLDPAMKNALIAKLAELLTKLERLHALLPQGETLALRSLDKAGALLREMEQAD